MIEGLWLKQEGRLRLWWGEVYNGRLFWATAGCCITGFPGGSAGKEPSCKAGDPSFIPGSGRSPGGGCGNPLQYSHLENPHGQRRLVDCSPWGHKESDMTERLSAAHSPAS